VISLAGKRALVSGGSRGIGAATAVLLAECGAHVVIGYRSRAADAEATVQRLRGFGVRAAAHASDVSSRDGAEALVTRALKELDGLDIFVGNAGVWPADEASLSAMSDERWRRTTAENLDSVFFTTRAAARQLAPGGRIVLVASTAGQRGEAYHADYAAAKGAIIALTKSLVAELAPRNVTVNCVAPGWVDTEMCAAPLTGSGRARIASTIPLGRIACPEDVAGPIVFLCSDLARHITGEVLNVNGGSVLCG
jgi:3-oxoacyl-[acyl-carrier protein] reductase